MLNLSLGTFSFDWPSILRKRARFPREALQKGQEKDIQPGEQRGIEKGRSEDEREAPQKIARMMLQSGIDRNTVMVMIDLSEEDIQRITH